MAKEMMIIFVYDTQMVQKEEDDPFSAILYFHPSWVSDQQKTALCGQLMGTAHCIKSIFSSPQIISLQSGKFFIKEYGRYFMAVGTDRNIADWLLEHRAKTMDSIVSFFYQDIEVMSKNYENSSKLSAKLYHLFETYLKYLFVGGNIFSYTPSLKLPKSSSNVFLEAIQLLQCCQEINYVLGGTILYHNKVLATQLSTSLTKIIVLTDPYRITCPAEVPGINFDMPMGVQLLQVYIPNKEYLKLNEEAIRSRTIFHFLSNKSIRKIQTKTAPKEPVLSAMKRDQSIIFTAVPEEDTDHSINSPLDKKITFPIRPNELQNRPKFLNLKSKVTDINPPEPKPTPKTNLPTPSVCSTPMTELSKVIHSRPLSICINLNEEMVVENLENTTTTNIMTTPSPSKLNNSTTTSNPTIKFKTIPCLKITKNLFDIKRFSSAFDIREKLKSIDSSITMKYYKIDLREECDENENNHANRIRRKTIADPNFPIFRSNGTVVSHNFYESYIRKELQLISNEVKEEKIISQKKMVVNTDIVDVIKKISKPAVEKPFPLQNSIANKDRRKSLNLPLKSLSIDSGDQALNTPMRRHSSGVQLTPLMSKLSSFEDRSSGFCSRDTTPSEYRIFTPTQSNFPFPFKKKIKPPIDPSDNSLQKCVLFVCGQQDMVMTLLLQEECATSLEPILKLWDLCTENLSKLEKQVHHYLETYPGNNMPSDSEPYSYLHLDHEWDTVDRGGPWGNMELGALTHFHRDFKEDSSLTEILLRSLNFVDSIHN